MRGVFVSDIVRCLVGAGDVQDFVTDWSYAQKAFTAVPHNVCAS
jgi:hypothetical protein